MRRWNAGAVYLLHPCLLVPSVCKPLWQLGSRALASTCDWSKFPTLTLQPPVAKRYNDKYGDTLFVRNVYEVRRMAYTLYNALGDEPDAWRDGKPLFKIYTEIPLEYEPYTDVFWPWRATEITDCVHELPNVRYYIDAYDEYKNGVFLNTRYCFMSI